jgi:GAF domain-containing protein
MDHRRLERLLSSLHATDGSSAVLDRICAVGVEGPISGAGVSRIVDGGHVSLAASDDRAQQVERLQVDFAEGPCLDAVHSFRPQFEPDLASPAAVTRWPRFASAARDHGVAAAFAFPLMTGGVAVGALDLYASRPGRLEAEQMRDALLLADLAALAVEPSAASATVAGVELSAEAVEPWMYSAVVHNASGMVSEQLGIGVDDALLRLRAVAFATDHSVAEVATDVVERRLRLESWAIDG